MRPFAWSDMTITTGQDRHGVDPKTHVSIEVRDGRMVVRPRRSRAVIAEIDGITAVRQTSRTTYELDTDTGPIELTRPRGCGCGGNR